ncbi:MAG TPA: FlgD immunoglobulin-like domain containing protein [Candidatus Krumholzibacteria bacterium]
MKRPVTPAFSLLLFGALACCLYGVRARAADELRLSPGRVVFTMKSNGEWTGFGVRGEPALVEHAGVLLYSSHPGTALLDERASSVRGGMRAVNATGQTLFEGMRGGARTPGLQPDDDNDGRVDEDPWDRIDNDNDGQTDEDFAAIGDEMLVAIYAGKGVSVRHEAYAWSLPHIDGMVASSIVVTNTGTKPVAHARIGIELDAGTGLDLGSAPTIDDDSRGGSAFVERQVVFDDHNRGLAALFMVPRSGLSTGATSAVSWDVRGEHDRVTVISPDLGDLAPGASARIDVALVALPSDDLKAVRATRSAHRTMIGDGTTRFIPPPVSLTRGTDAFASGHDAGASRESFDDPFWNQAGKLQETLLVGSPNPFRDAIRIEYQIPSRVTDEDGVDHDLPASGERASVKIYNVAGRLVATLVDQPHSAGSYRTGWTARNADGTTVANGVYYVKLQIGKRSVTTRMVQLR